MCAVLLIGALYLANLTGMGLVNPDEPRYADIGRAMASTGDWITPRLWGQPWFEKPPLLYWLIAIGFGAGLNQDLAPRLPVALMSLAFLIFFWRKVRAIWDENTANYATAMLATSGGWLAYSHVAVTDIPVAVMFSMAVLFALERRIAAVAAALGFAVLAKSLVPLVLFAPMLALDHRNWRDWVRPLPVTAFLCIALPWHILCALRNGPVFLWTLFVQQQFGRFVSTERQHQQHWWFYLPVLLLLLFPWFPFLLFAGRRWKDSRTRALLSVAAFGFLFFSASVNKLPGYLLPLLPALCILMALGMAAARNIRAASTATAALLGTLPLLVAVIPAAMEHGLRNSFGAAAAPALPVAVLFTAAAAGIVFLLRRWAFFAAFLLWGPALLWLQHAVFPRIDSATSARSIWLSEHPGCTKPGTERGMLYGLYYYAQEQLPECHVTDQTDGGIR